MSQNFRTAKIGKFYKESTIYKIYQHRRILGVFALNQSAFEAGDLTAGTECKQLVRGG